MTTALDNITPHSSYDGVDFYWKTGSGGIKTSPRFGNTAAVVERIAPYSYPATISRQVINTGLLEDFSITAGVTAANLALLKAKVETGMKSLILSGDASQQAILTKVNTPVDAVPTLGFIYITMTFRGRGI